MHDPDNLENFKRGVDNLLSRRSYFISQVLPKLKENQDYFIVRGRKSLAKGGSEKLASIYNLTASFEKDTDTIEMLGSPKGLVAFICNLKNRDGVVAGQGRGADMLDRNQGDPNKTIKMSQKSAYIDAVIRTTGLSDIFTQDIEAVNPIASANQHSNEEQKGWVEAIVGEQQIDVRDAQTYNSTLTDRQRKYLISLITSRIVDEEEREQRFEQMENLTKQEASEWIQQMCSS